MLPVYKVAQTFDFEKLFKVAPYEMALDWFSETVSTPVRFAVALDSTRLWFGASCAARPNCNRELKVGQFEEGLWHKDVAEIFLKEDGSERYQEFNLSPAGAWWSCVFAKYRKMENPNSPPPAGVECFSEVSGTSWRCALAVPLMSLGVKLNFDEESQMNVCAIIGHPVKRYLSWASISTVDPDFHRATDFETIEVLEG